MSQSETELTGDALVEYLARVEPRVAGPYRRPRDSATLILLDGPPSAPRVLLGKRHQRHAFLPGKFVFPGGAIDAGDSRIKTATALDADSERRLLAQIRRPSPARARALALTAIRETCEETGLLIGQRGDAPAKLAPAWKPFHDAGMLPHLGALTFVARAITPPGRIRRFDTRFFVAHRRDVAAEVPGIVGPDAELIELRWLTFDEARAESLPHITRVTLGEIERRLQAASFSRPPVPFYYFRNGRPYREEIE
ncbi:MAG: NUDIX hydrolase [Bradyrhizobiaceae bacterium]|nr:NUDIX hydrolase [Bradyrhizobiaceae bacterium]